MATSESDVTTKAPAGAGAVAGVTRSKESLLDKILRLLSSVRFGIIMLSLLLVCCMIGMLIMQINVDGFQEYYRNLTPSQRAVYGTLGFFDIYKVWYFQLLLAITGLNIILASIDRFPAAWQYIVKPKRTASPKFIAAQMFNEEAKDERAPKESAEFIRNAWRGHGFRGKVTEEGGRITVFAQRNSWNRLGAYVVHVALLMIFIGGYLTSTRGVGGNMRITPGMTPSREFIVTEFSPEGEPVLKTEQLPFAIGCTDLQQKLIREEGGLGPDNTIDWLSSITINDGEKEPLPMLVHLNNVGDYRGYRFFQSMFDPEGSARQATLVFRPADGGAAVEAAVKRDEGVEVAGIGQVFFRQFWPDFSTGGESMGRGMSGGLYSDPVAGLEVVGAGGERIPVLATRHNQPGGPATGNPHGEAEKMNILKIGDRVYEVELKEFEKVSRAHTLTIQYDPGRTPVYLGFTLLSLALCGVFFFSHQRVWAVIEPEGNGSKVHFGGHTNRNKPAFEERFKRVVNSVTGGGAENE
jgi:cytochrome c biogenesis protein